MKKINFQYICAIKLQHVLSEGPLDSKGDGPFHTQSFFDLDAHPWLGIQGQINMNCRE